MRKACMSVFQIIQGVEEFVYLDCSARRTELASGFTVLGEDLRCHDLRRSSRMKTKQMILFKQATSHLRCSDGRGDA